MSDESELKIGGYTEFRGDTFAVELKRGNAVVGVIPADMVPDIESLTEIPATIEEKDGIIDDLKIEVENRERECDRMETERDRMANDAADLLAAAQKVVDSIPQGSGRPAVQELREILVGWPHDD